MDMDRESIRKIVVESVHSVLPDDPAAAIDEDTLPIGDLGLVSADGVDLSLELEDRLKCAIDDKVNPLVSDDGKRARSVKDIVDLIMHSRCVRQEQPEHA